MIKLNINSIDALGKDINKVYEDLKNVFVSASKFIQNAGDNEISIRFLDECKVAEKLFNEKALIGVLTFKKAIATYIENNEAWTRSIKAIDPIDGSKLKNSNVKQSIKPFSMT